MSNGKRTIAANQCAIEDCGKPRILPRPWRSDPSKMTHGSIYCPDHAKVARAARKAMFAEQKAAQAERFSKFSALVEGLLPSENLGNSGWYIRVASASTSFAYFLLTRTSIAKRIDGEYGVLVPVASEEVAAVTAGLLLDGLQKMDQNAVRVSYTDKIGQAPSAPNADPLRE